MEASGFYTWPGWAASGCAPSLARWAASKASSRAPITAPPDSIQCTSSCGLPNSGGGAVERSASQSHTSGLAASADTAPPADKRYRRTSAANCTAQATRAAWRLEQHRANRCWAWRSSGVRWVGFINLGIILQELERLSLRSCIIRSFRVNSEHCVTKPTHPQRARLDAQFLFGSRSGQS